MEDHRSQRALADVLAEVEGWAPDTVAVGVTDPTGTLATHGPVEQVLPFTSVTKPLAAYAILIAIQDGTIALDEPVEVDGAHDGITVRHLLAHAGGLPMDEGGPVTAVGQKRIYSNWGFDVLAQLTEERLDLPFDDHLDIEVLTPLGMSGTRLDGSPADAGEGTVADLLAFARELLDPQLLDRELFEVATRPVFAELGGVVPGFGRQEPNPWGLGFEVRDEKDPHWTGSEHAAETFGHFGGSGSFLWVDPRRDLAAVLLADQEFGGWAKEVWPAFNDAILAAAP
ncbi:MAG: serine hydrolase domain-containing protein [Nitriliruptoraceae bacterium]